MSSLATGHSQVPSATLRRDRDRFVAFAFTWADILFELDDEARIAYASGVLEAVVGRTQQQLLGTPFCDLVVPHERTIARSLLASVRLCERTEGGMLSLLGPNGQPVRMAFSGYRLPELGGHVFIGLRGKGQQYERAASRDEGSGLLKSRAFVESVRQHLSAPAVDKERRLSLIRLLGFEELQQQPASEPERQLLGNIGDRLRSQAIDGDLATRLGADRFALLHGTGTDIGQLQNQLLNLVADADLQSKRLAIECASFEIDCGALRTEEIAKGIVYVMNRFRASDRGASELCRASRSRSFKGLAQEAVRAIDGLRGIISRGDYGLVFQPILDCHSGSIHHYEALARFPALCGTTGEHIMLAEEIGAISEFDSGMLHKVFARLGEPAEDRARIAVNVSGQSVNSAAYTASLGHLLDENPWLHDRLMFEITESSRMDDLRLANEFVLKLRSRGYAVCLDDFGAGAANFQYLASLDVDIVKLDGAAVRCAQGSAKGMAFLKALVGLCRELSIGTVVEMVDSPASLQFARACGAEYVQGYLFGRPHADIGLFERILPRHLFRPDTQPTV